jgi:ABC-type nitrate/sulfonate/bicarbonate transport system ATPase subunit
MIKDVVIHNGLLRIATGTFVCMVGDSERGQSAFLL